MPAPFLVMQDLNFAILLEHSRPEGVPHFRDLSGRIDALRRRQDMVYARAAMLLPTSRWLRDHLVAGGFLRNAYGWSILARLLSRPSVPQSRKDGSAPSGDCSSSDETSTPRAELRSLRLPSPAARDGIERYADRGRSRVLAATWRCPWSISFLGKVPHVRVGELMDAADLLVMPSYWKAWHRVRRSAFPWTPLHRTGCLCDA